MRLRYFLPLVATLLVVILSSSVWKNRGRKQLDDKLSPQAQEQRMMSTSPAASDSWQPKTEQQWREILSPEEFYVTQKKGTERAFTGEYWDCKKSGIYRCRCCEAPLFSSQTKYKSGSGWPSFWQPIAENNIKEVDDNSLFARRTEVICQRCEAHLGHVFSDGPQPTGLRYCMNSLSLKLDESAAETPESEK